MHTFEHFYQPNLTVARLATNLIHFIKNSKMKFCSVYFKVYHVYLKRKMVSANYRIANTFFFNEICVY